MNPPIPAHDHDVFISYARATEMQLADDLQGALDGLGLSVFRDTTAIEAFAALPDRIIAALSGSIILVALYSPTYPQSRACQWELTAAYLACQRLKIDPVERILIVNVPPDGAPHSVAHIHPNTLQAQLIPAVDGDHGKLAASIKARLSAIKHRAAPGRPAPLGAPPANLGPPRVLPALRRGSPRFVGRTWELWQLHEALNTNRKVGIGETPRPAVVHALGVGGVGKSLLAEEYALRFGSAYSAGVLWFDLGGVSASPAQVRANAEAQLRRIAAVLDLRPGKRPYAEIRAEVEATVMSTGGEALVVLDDLPPGLGRDVLDHLTLVQPCFSHLYTTRADTYGAALIGERVEVGVLSTNQACELLACHGGVDAHEPVAEQIVEALGCLPLAVDVASIYLARAAALTSPEAFLRSLAHPSPDVLEIAGQVKDELPNGHDKSITATLLASIALLATEGRRVLEAAAVLSPLGIDARLIAAVLRGHYEHFSDEMVLRGLAGERGASSHSLARQDDQDGDWHVHGLVSRVMRHRLDAVGELQALQDAARRAVETIVQSGLHQPNESLVRSALTHGRALVDGLQSPQGLKFAGTVARGEYALGNYASARELHGRVLDRRRETLGAEHPDTLMSMNNLATTLAAEYNFADARDVYEEVLEVMCRVLGEGNRDTLTCMNNLATVLLDLGDMQGAERLHRRALAGRSRSLGGAHPDTIESMGNLASVLMQGEDLPGAQELQELVVRACSQVHGERHPATLTAMNNLAGTRMGRGDVGGAIGLLVRVVEGRSLALGRTHPATLSGANNLARALAAYGDLSGARTVGDSALAAARATLGPGHDVTRALDELIDALTDASAG